MKQFDKYKIFNDIDKDGISPKRYKKMKLHLIYDIRYDTTHKVRYVPDENLIEIPRKGVYYGVVSLRGLHMMIFLDKLNHIHTWEADIGNVYLKAKISANMYINARQEFGEK